MLNLLDRLMGAYEGALGWTFDTIAVTADAVGREARWLAALTRATP